MAYEKPVFAFDEIELARYEAHGIAHARLNQMCPVPIAECFVDTIALSDIAAPTNYWNKHTPEAPHLIIVSAKAQSVPEKAEMIDLEQSLEGIRVRMHYPRAQKRVDTFDIIYK